MQIKPDFSLILAVYLALLLLGIGYNLAIGWAERRKYLEGFVSLAVVLGVLATLGGVAVISWQAALICLGAFTASGLPMVGGSVWRYIRARGEAQRDYVRQAERLAQLSEGDARPGR